MPLTFFLPLEASYKLFFINGYMFHITSIRNQHMALLCPIKIITFLLECGSFIFSPSVMQKYVSFLIYFASVHCCLVVTCWERADLLALVCDV